MSSTVSFSFAIELTPCCAAFSPQYQSHQPSQFSCSFSQSFLPSKSGRGLAGSIHGTSHHHHHRCYYCCCCCCCFIRVLESLCIMRNTGTANDNHASCVCFFAHPMCINHSFASQVVCLPAWIRMARSPRFKDYAARDGRLSLLHRPPHQTSR